MRYSDTELLVLFLQGALCYGPCMVQALSARRYPLVPAYIILVTSNARLLALFPDVWLYLEVLLRSTWCVP
jgi:hypothetical protein